MNFHIVKTYFNQSKKESQAPDYFPKRFALFEKYTLKSLEAQTFRNFVIWVHCSPGMEKIMEPLKRRQKKLLFTYGEHFPEKIPWKENLYNSRHVYVTRIDSDDLYRHDAIELVARRKPRDPEKVDALMFKKGYIFDLRTQALGWYENPSQPFHTLIFPTSIFVDSKAYEKVFVGDHSMITAKYKVQTMLPWRFCVLLHDLNCGSTWENRGAKTIHLNGFTPERFINGAYNFRS